MGKYKSDKHKCIITGSCPVDLHHVKSRKSGGPDEQWNLMPLSRDMHRKMHDKGLSTMAMNYEHVYEWLKKNNWYLCPVTFKWRHE